MPVFACLNALGKRIICLLLTGMLFFTGCAGRSDKEEVTPLTVKEEERFCLEFRGVHLEEETFRAILDQELRDNDLPGLVSCRADTVVIRVKEEELFNVDGVPLSGNTLLRHYEVAKWFLLRLLCVQCPSEGRCWDGTSAPLLPQSKGLGQEKHSCEQPALTDPALGRELGPGDLQRSLWQLSSSCIALLGCQRYAWHVVLVSSPRRHPVLLTPSWHRSFQALARQDGVLMPFGTHAGWQEVLIKGH